MFPDIITAMRLATGALFLTLLSLPARTEDAVDQALADLASDDAQKRDAAERALSDAGGAALDRAAAAFRNTTDPEARARLEKLLPWLRIDASTEVFLKACRDQWFALREKGEITGVEHHTAELTGKGRDRVWTFVEEAWLKGDGDQVFHGRHRLSARHDANLTPLEAEYELLSPRGDHTLWKFGKGTIGLNRIRRADTDDYDPWDDPEVMDAAGPQVKLDGGPAHPVVLEANFERILERATCAGLERIEVSLLHLYGSRGRFAELVLVSEDTPATNAAGRKTAPLSWKMEFRGQRMPGGLLVSAERGALRWELDGVAEVDASDEKACRATGFVREVVPEAPPATK